MPRFMKEKIVAKTSYGKEDPEVVKTKHGDTAETDGTSVTASLGVTISAKYNSCRVDVGVTIPTTKGNRDKAFVKAWDICGEQLDAQISAARKFLDSL